MNIRYHIVGNQGWYETDSQTMQDLNLRMNNPSSFVNASQSVFLEHDTDGEAFLQALRNRNVTPKLRPLYGEKSPLSRLVSR